MECIHFVNAWLLKIPIIVACNITADKLTHDWLFLRFIQIYNNCFVWEWTTCSMLLDFKLDSSFLRHHNCLKKLAVDQILGLLICTSKILHDIQSCPKYLFVVKQQMGRFSIFMDFLVNILLVHLMLLILVVKKAGYMEKIRKTWKNIATRFWELKLEMIHSI